MNLRDSMAMQALPAVIKKYPNADEIGAAELAYSYADAMILARDIDPAYYGSENATQGYGNSRIATKYVWQRIYGYISYASLLISKVTVPSINEIVARSDSVYLKGWKHLRGR